MLIDAESGLAVVSPSGAELDLAARIRAALARVRSEQPTPRQPVTRDGVAIRLALNISDPKQAAARSAIRGQRGGSLPDRVPVHGPEVVAQRRGELRGLRTGGRAIGSGELHIRLADFGADKCPDYADFPMGRNPSLGVRGVRLLLQRDDILGPQVTSHRAACRTPSRRVAGADAGQPGYTATPHAQARGALWGAPGGLSLPARGDDRGARGRGRRRGDPGGRRSRLDRPQRPHPVSAGGGPRGRFGTALPRRTAAGGTAFDLAGGRRGRGAREARERLRRAGGRSGCSPPFC